MIILKSNIKIYDVIYNDEKYIVTITKKGDIEEIEIVKENQDIVDDITFDEIERYIDLIIEEN